jgi:hypothetical protein
VHLVYHIRLYDASSSNTILIAQFIMGLKDELKLPIEMQLPDSMATIQEKLLDKGQKRQYKCFSVK